MTLMRSLDPGLGLVLVRLGEAGHCLAFFHSSFFFPSYIQSFLTPKRNGLG